MIIETKIGIFDDAWFMCDNKPHCSDVKEISIKVNNNTDIFDDKKTVDIEYKVIEIASTVWMNEDYIFATKQDLLNSL